MYDGTEAQLVQECPNEKMYEVGKVKWRNTDYTVYLLSNVPFTLTKYNNTNPALFSLLKSNLQKQIRRKDIHAVSTCEEMLSLNPFECLRRLSIIAAEDVEISKETSVIVWLMSAVSKGYVLSDSQKKYVLIYVPNLCGHKICRRLVISSVYDLSIFDTTLELLLSSTHPNKHQLAGIFFRTCYGGLVGDIPMLNRMCGYEIYKFNTRINNQQTKDQTKDQTNNNLLSFKNRLMIKTDLSIHEAAVDFHIYPSLCEDISKDTNVDVNIIKTVIWECSSRINLRQLENASINNQELWKIIKKSYNYHTKKYLNDLFEKL